MNFLLKKDEIFSACPWVQYCIRITLNLLVNIEFKFEILYYINVQKIIPPLRLEIE